MGVSSWEYTINRYGQRAVELLVAEWHLGFTAFGGPPVHFKIVGNPNYERVGVSLTNVNPVA